MSNTTLSVSVASLNNTVKICVTATGFLVLPFGSIESAGPFSVNETVKRCEKLVSQPLPELKLMLSSLHKNEKVRRKSSTRCLIALLTTKMNEVMTWWISPPRQDGWAVWEAQAVELRW